LTVLLDTLRLPAPADSLMLWARRIDQLDDWQEELFTTESNDARDLGDLVDRLAVRLGPQAVVKPELLSDHQPERAFRYTSFSSPKQTAAKQLSGSTPPGPRPLRLSPRPMEVAVTAIVPEGPPIAFRLRGTQHVVTKSTGPERIETGWWRGPYVQRDYYRATVKDGRCAWLFRRRDTGQWFLHGWFD
jgi:protein ImuB